MLRLQVGDVQLPMRLAMILVVVAVLSASTIGLARADNLGSKSVLMWEHVEWQLGAGGVSGNPFDAVATVVFTHGTDPGANHTTEMFYVGGDTWAFRFTGTKIGSWSFVTQSSAPELGGHSGAVIVAANPDSTVKGFLTNVGNKFAVQTGNDGRLRGFLYNVFQHQDADNPTMRIRDSGIQNVDQAFVNTYIDEAEDNGMNVIFFLVMDADTVWTDASDNPNIATFDKIDMILRTARARGVFVDFWLHGDGDRGWTPQQVFSGGALGIEDQRLNRYIAARMGPIPNWTMQYGFDLQEWVPAQGDPGAWADFLNSKLGYSHLLSGRGYAHTGLGVKAYSGFGKTYADAVSNMSGDTSRPHHFAERDYWPDRTSSDSTLQRMWHFAMAGGHGGHWGMKGSENMGAWVYPTPLSGEEMKAHFTFWHTNNRFMLDMAPANYLINTGYALKSAANQNYVFFAEGVRSVTVDLSSMSGAQPVVAVNTNAAYSEVDLGALSTGTGQVINLPFSSDWAIAVGEFESSSSPTTVPNPPTGLRVE